MARLRTRQTILLSTDSSELSQVFERVQSEDELTDAYTQGTSRGVLTIGPSATLTLNTSEFSNIQFIYLETDKPITVSLNGGAAIPVRPRNGPTVNSVTPVVQGKLSLMTDGVTAVALQNPDGTNAAKVLVVLAGA